MLEIGSFQHPPFTQLVEEVFILFSVSYEFYHSSPPPHPPLHVHITEFYPELFLLFSGSESSMHGGADVDHPTILGELYPHQLDLDQVYARNTI